VITMKKAQGMSMQTIVIAAVALLVLIVLIAIFSGRMGTWGSGLDSATEGSDCSGTGVSVVTGSCLEGHKQLFGIFSNVETGEACCKQLTYDCIAKDNACTGTKKSASVCIANGETPCVTDTHRCCVT